MFRPLKAPFFVMMQIKHVGYIYITSRVLVDKLYALGNTIISLKLYLHPSGVKVPTHQHCCRKSIFQMYTDLKQDNSLKINWRKASNLVCVKILFKCIILMRCVCIRDNT